MVSGLRRRTLRWSESIGFSTGQPPSSWPSDACSGPGGPRHQQRLVARPEVRGEGARVAADLVGSARGHNLAGLHHDHLGAQLEDQGHVVLDQHDGGVGHLVQPAEERDERLGLALGDPGGGLVEEEQPRAGQHDRRQVDDPPGPGRELRGAVVRGSARGRTRSMTRSTARRLSRSARRAHGICSVDEMTPTVRRRPRTASACPRRTARGTAGSPGRSGPGRAGSAPRAGSRRGPRRRGGRAPEVGATRPETASRRWSCPTRWGR